eukprot:s1688_g7.t1
MAVVAGCLSGARARDRLSDSFDSLSRSGCSSNSAAESRRLLPKRIGPESWIILFHCALPMLESPQNARFLSSFFCISNGHLILGSGRTSCKLTGSG